MRVLLVSQFLVGGGLERMVHTLGKSLVRDFGCKVFFFSFDGENDLQTRQDLEEAGVTTVHSLKSRGFSLKTALEIKRLIQAAKIDVVHTHETAPLMYSTIARALCGRHVGLVHTQHSFVHLQTRAFLRHYDRNFQRAAHFVTAVSQQLVDEYTRLGVSTKRIILVPNGVEFSDSRKSRAELISQTRQSNVSVETAAALREGIEKIWLISMARLNPGKGQDHLIRLWAALPSKFRERCLLILAGPETFANERARLESLIQAGPNADQIVFTGRITSPLSWLSASDVFLSGSDYEGMPLAPIEACGAGLPLLLSNIDGHQVLARHAKMFNLNNSNDGAARLVELVNERDNDAASFAAARKAAVEEMRAHYGITKMAATYFDLYQKSSKKN